ncbi:MAG: C4-type zinc ribbon domain-containing protein [Campylobacterota bacterium]|nr:C4-type zinc ribbon domain-containing protein [Campylobacterota bacterium]
MNKHLEQLIDLSQIDKDIDAFEPQVEIANKKLSAVEKSQNDIISQVEELESSIKDEKIKRQKNELHLAELSAKLEENSKKSAAIKSEREMKSLQLEEEIAKEQINFANEEIERLDKVIDSKESSVKELEAKKDELDSKVNAIKEEVQVELVKIDEDRKKVFMKKEKLVSKMSQKGLTFYEKIRRWAKNTTAVPVKKQACMGCYMVVNDKTYADVIRGEEITTCPHCGRLLYIEPTDESA